MGKKKISKLMKSNTIKGLLYLSPALIILVLFKIYPIIKSFTMAFYTDFDYLSGAVINVKLKFLISVQLRLLTFIHF